MTKESQEQLAYVMTLESQGARGQLPTRGRQRPVDYC